MLETCDLAARARKLTALARARLGNHNLTPHHAQPDPYQVVAPVEHVGGDRLLARLERSQPRRLVRDRSSHCPNLADDLNVLVPDSLREHKPLQKVGEALGFKHNGDQVGTIGFVAAHKLPRENHLGVRLK